MWATICHFLAEAFGNLAQEVASRVTWRRVVVIAIFGAVLASTGSLLFSVGQSIIGTIRSFSGDSVASFDVGDVTWFNSVIGILPEHIRYLFYCIGVDWIVWLALSFVNLYILQLAFRRLVRWLASAVGAVYHSL